MHELESVLEGRPGVQTGVQQRRDVNAAARSLQSVRGFLSPESTRWLQRLSHKPAGVLTANGANASSMVALLSPLEAPPPPSRGSTPPLQPGSQASTPPPPPTDQLGPPSPPVSIDEAANRANAVGTFLSPPFFFGAAAASSIIKRKPSRQRTSLSAFAFHTKRRRK